VMDRDSITGAFLNSDDTGLTTNVFLTEPRLYGLRVTKEWTGGSLFSGFASRGSGPYPLTVEIGGQVQRHDAPYEALRPDVLANFSDALQPTVQNRDLDWGDGRSIRLTYKSEGPWSVAAGVRFGRTNTDVVRERREQFGDVDVCAYLPSDSVVFYGQAFDKYANCDPESSSFNPDALATETNWSYSQARDHEEHMIVDFEVGHDFGFGGLGLHRSALLAGLRYAQFKSESSLTVDGIPDWEIPPGWKSAFIVGRPANPASFHRYDASVMAEREFDGAGPVIAWDAAQALLGDEGAGRLMVAWTIGGGVMFGKQNTSVLGEERAGYWTGTYNAGTMKIPTFDPDEPIAFDRSESVTVPVVDLSLGLSYEIDRIEIGAGYRWERYFDVLDGGYDEAEPVDRTIDGPYFKVSVGFGG
jgi:hypothetical protein